MFIVIKKMTLIIAASMVVICGVLIIGFASANEKTHVIVLDAGHGEPDGGCVAEDGTKESVLNLSVTKMLEKNLADSGYKTIMTREDENGIHKSDGTIKNKKRDDMEKRLNIKTSSSADIFVSVHMNKFEQKKYHGAQVLYDKTNENAKKLAEKIQQELNKADESNTRLAMETDGSIFLLKSSPVPSVIVECGFLSNTDELERLKTKEYQKKIADAICAGIKNYFLD